MMKHILTGFFILCLLFLSMGCMPATDRMDQKTVKTEEYTYLDWNNRRYVLGVKDAALEYGDTWVVPKEIDGVEIFNVYLTSMGHPIRIIAPNSSVRHLIFTDKVFCYPTREIRMNFDLDSVVVLGSDVPSFINLTRIKHAVFLNSYFVSLDYVTCLRSLEVNWTSFTMQSLAPLEYLRFQEGVKTISSEIFRELPLKQVVLPETVTRISADSFAGCEDFTVFLRAEEPLPGFEEGWDKDVRVVWGFAGETVTFDSYGGSRVVFPETGQNYQIAEAGGKLQKPEDPVREGYTFGGWYKDFYFRELWDFEADTVQETCCLWAKWVPA